jgi:hypothetical protein
MENPSAQGFRQEEIWETQAPGLSGVVGRMRLLVAGQPVGLLVVDNDRVKLTPDAGPVDVSLECSTREHLVDALRGELNPVVAALRGWARLQGNREMGVKIIYGLREGSPLASAPLAQKEN